MYTAGHEEILKEALALFGKQKVWSNKKDMKQLFDGLQYPDFPCGDYQLHIHEKETGKVKKRMIFKKKLCSLFQLVNDIAIMPNIFASAFASHNGYFSVWHSMTYNPDRTVGQITNDIIDQILSFLLLAISNKTINDHESVSMSRKKTDNLFWLGMALHVIMDAYSPAHVLRVTSTRPHCNAGCLVDIVKAHPAKMTFEMTEANKILRELKDRLMEISVSIDLEDTDQIDRILQELFQKHDIVSYKKQKQLKSTANFLFFHNHQQNKIKNLTRQKKLATVKDASNIPYYRDGIIRPIVTYYYYPQQSSWFHKWNDRIAAAKNEDLYNAAVADTYAIMRMYLKAISEKSFDDDDIEEFLRQAKNYLVHVTFKLAKDVSMNKTGVSNEFYDALKSL